MSEHAEVTTPWTAGGVTRDRFVTEGDEREGIFSLGDVNIFPSSGPGPVAIAAGSELAEQIVKAVNSHDALVKALTEVLEANADFRKGMPEGWEGDPLQDACDRARALVGETRSEP